MNRSYSRIEDADFRVSFVFFSSSNYYQTIDQRFEGGPNVLTALTPQMITDLREFLSVCSIRKITTKKTNLFGSDDTMHVNGKFKQLQLFFSAFQVRKHFLAVSWITLWAWNKTIQHWSYFSRIRYSRHRSRVNSYFFSLHSNSTWRIWNFGFTLDIWEVDFG